MVATAQSAVKLPQEYYDSIDVLLIDEFHHGAAETYHKINAKAVNVFYRICLTGTHFRTSDDKLAMEALCSEVLYRIPVPYLVENRYLKNPRVVFARSHGKVFSSSDWAGTYDRGIVDCEPRNERIALIAKTTGLDNCMPTLVLVKRRRHADELGERIPDSTVVKGGENALTGDAIQAFREGDIPILIGTTVLGEGVDLPNASVAVYASGGGGSVQQIQSYFRPLTAGAEQGTIYDFQDHHHLTLSRHSNDRVSMAQQYLGDCVVRI
jgi:superfamily II DNA or RNA helicase